MRPSKIDISKEVELRGTLLSPDILMNEQVVSILPEDKKKKTFFHLKNPSNKKDIQVLCGMLASLQSSSLYLPMNNPMLRKAAGSRGKMEWNEELEADY